MKLAIVVAAAENGVIGRAGTLPWHLPRDLQHFKKLTMGHPVLMGRKTFASIGRPLPGRRNVVLSRDEVWAPPGVEVMHDLDQAVARLEDEHRVFVIGGESLFAWALPRADRVHLTLVHAAVEGDVWFPLEVLATCAWRLAHTERHAADEKHAFDVSFLDYERVV